MIETILKRTDKEFGHPDLETLPTILDIVKNLVKSTEVGIEAAEKKVKLWEMVETLVVPPDEIIVGFSPPMF